MQQWEYLQISGSSLKVWEGGHLAHPSLFEREDAGQDVWFYSHGGYDRQEKIRYSEEFEDRRGEKLEMASALAPNIAAMLNRLGAQGWELVGTIPYENHASYVTLLLKRPKE